MMKDDLVFIFVHDEIPQKKIILSLYMGLNIPLFSGYPLLLFPPLLTPLPLKEKRS